MNSRDQDLDLDEDDSLLESEDEIDELEVNFQPTRKSNQDNLDTRRRIERYEELKRLRELTDDPSLLDNLD
jgi:hypothetical protein